MRPPASPAASPLLRRRFTLRGEVQRARAYVTSRGLYELHLNGRRVGDQLFTRGWTSLNKRLQYQTDDVTALLTKGDNVAAAVLGSGWYRGEIGWTSHRNHYGKTLALLAQIDIVYRDDRRETVGTDASWKASTGPILMSELYAGETYDARLEQPNWTRPGFDDGAWAAVTVSSASAPPLIAPAGPPVRRIEERTPARILATPAGLTVVDMGQNMVGWVRLRVSGPAGATVTLRHAEVLDKVGNFYIENLRNAAATDRYTLKGGGPEIYEPHFTFHGFRYVAVEGYPIHSDMPQAGQKPDGSFQDKGMNSFNHYAYGAIGDWMYRVMAGIEIDEAEPGYRHVLIQPRPGGTFTHAAATHRSMYGPVSSKWALDGGTFTLAVSIPPNTRATLRLPGATLAGVSEGGAPLAGAKGITNARQERDDVVLEAGSGDYELRYRRSPR